MRDDLADDKDGVAASVLRVGISMRGRWSGEKGVS